MVNENEENEIEGVESENEVMYSDNEGVDNKFLPPLLYKLRRRQDSETFWYL